MAALTARVTVRSYELDSFGHVNNAVYLNYLEVARSAYLKQLGLSFAQIAASGIHIVIVDAHLRFVRQARDSETLRIDGALESLKAASVVFTYRIVREDDGALVATASTLSGCIDTATGRPVRWPEAFRSAFATVASATP